MCQCNSKNRRFCRRTASPAHRVAPRKPAWILALRDVRKLFSTFFKKIQKNPKVPESAAVTRFMKRVKVSDEQPQRALACKDVVENNLKFFCGNPKVPEKVAVTGLDVAKKSRHTNYFFVS